MHTMNLNQSWSAKETRLIARGNIPQLGRDIRDFHIRADDPLAAAGTVVMAPAAALGKIGNAIGGTLSPEEAVPLGEGGLKYIEQDVATLKENAKGAARNLLGVRPIKFGGNVLAGALSVADLVTIDPLLDIGSGAFGHQERKTRAAIAHTLATAA
jgi:hypothetical protein